MNSFSTGRSLVGVSELEDLSDHSRVASVTPVSSVRRSMLHSGHWYSYGQMYGEKQNQGSVDHLSGFNGSGYGLEVGVFRQMNPELSLGVLMGYQRLDSTFKDGIGSLKDNHYRLGPFLSWSNGPSSFQHRPDLWRV